MARANTAVGYPQVSSLQTGLTAERGHLCDDFPHGFIHHLLGLIVVQLPQAFPEGLIAVEPSGTGMILFIPDEELNEC